MKPAIIILTLLLAAFLAGFYWQDEYEIVQMQDEVSFVNSYVDSQNGGVK